MRFLRKKPTSTSSENEGTDDPKEIVWGIRVAPSVRSRWKALAKALGIPVGRLVAYVLAEWLRRNWVLVTSDAGRVALAKAIARVHREGKLD